MFSISNAYISNKDLSLTLININTFNTIAKISYTLKSEKN